MSSLKSGALLSLFSGFSFEAVQRPHQKRDAHTYDHYPSPSDVAHAARFSGPAQVSVTKFAAADVDRNAAADLRDAA
jgi:hypothetical protein